MSPAATIPISLAAAVLWCAALAAAGARVRALTRLPLSPALTLPIDFLIGAWMTACLALTGGLAGLFSPAVLVGATIVCALFGKWRGNGWRLRPFILIGAPCTLLVPVALAPPFFYDALVYHLGLPWQALMEGRLSPHPENLFAAFPPLAQLVYAAPISVGLDRVPALLHLASFVAAGVAIAALARGLGAPALMASLAGATLPLLPAVTLVPGLPAAEGWVLAPVIGAVAMLFRKRILRAGEARTVAILAGLLCGAASSARLQGLAWSAIVIAALAVRAGSARAVSPAVASWFVGSAPWWLKNLLLLGNPIAPIGWHREGMETLWRDAGSFTGLVTAAAALAPHIAYAGPLVLAAILAAISRGGAIAPAGAPVGRRAAFLCGAALAGALVWAATGTLPRFLAPALAILLAIAAASGRTRIGAWAGGSALIVAFALGVVTTAREEGRWGGVGMALQASGSDLRGAVTNDPTPAFREARTLPAGARVLFIGEARSFGFPRRCVAPSQHDVSPLREPIESLSSAEAVRAWLAAQGYTDLLVNFAELGRLERSYPVAPWRTEEGRRRLDALLGLLGPPLIRSGEVAIFKL